MNEMKYSGQELELFQYAIRWKKYWMSIIRPYFHGEVLEVGAGKGANIPYILQHSDQISGFTALEPDIKLYEEMIRRGANDMNIQYIHGVISDIPTEKKFDCILYIDVLEHIKNDREEMLWATTHLKSGGNLIILVPAYEFLFSSYDSSIGHWRRYNKKSLTDAIPDHMYPVRMLYLDSVGLLSSLANKFILKQNYPSLRQLMFWDRYMIPVSRGMDALIGYSLGRSLVGVWRKT